MCTRIFCCGAKTRLKQNEIASIGIWRLVSKRWRHARSGLELWPVHTISGVSKCESTHCCMTLVLCNVPEQQATRKRPVSSMEAVNLLGHEIMAGIRSGAMFGSVIIRLSITLLTVCVWHVALLAQLLFCAGACRTAVCPSASISCRQRLPTLHEANPQGCMQRGLVL